MTALSESRLELMRRRLAATEPHTDVTTDVTTVEEPVKSPGVLGVAERRMWRIHELDPESLSHNIGLHLTLGPGRDVAEVVRAVQQMVAHPVFASVITVDDGVPRRVPREIRTQSRDSDTVREWNIPAESATDDAVTLTRIPFRLDAEPPVRVRVRTQPDGRTAVTLVVHHLTVDGTSWPALLGPLAGGTESVTVALSSTVDTDPTVDVESALRHAMGTWAADDVRHPLTGLLPETSAESSWLAPMDDAEVAHHRHTLDPEVVAALSGVAREVGATSNAVLIAVCALAVHALSGTTDHVLLVPTDNRRSTQDPRTVGYCGNIVPMRFSVDPTASVRETLRHLTSTIYSSMEYSAVDFGTVLTALRSRGGRFPVADVLASVRDAPLRGATTPGSGVTCESVPTGVGNYPLSYAFEIDEDDRIHLEIDRRIDAVDTETGAQCVDITLAVTENLSQALDSTVRDLVDAVRARCSVAPLPARTSRFASPGSGWADVGAGLIRLADSVGDDTHHGAPLPRGLPGDVLDAVAATLGPPTIPLGGVGETAALAQIGQLIARHGLDLTHSATAAHLQPPPLTVAVVADALASATNASLDTYDSGPATLAIEKWMITALADLAGLGDTAGGVFGPGGSYSNLLALLIARDHTATQRGLDTRRDGSGTLHRPAVFCSRVAHFSVHRACAALGLGEAAVIPIDVDDSHRMIPSALDAALSAASDRTAIAVIATAGTTDFGTVDPLPAIAEVARRHGVWLHVDAAYGFGSVFSDRLRGLVDGIDRADSITLDLHKIGWQPAAASVLLLADEGRFASLDRSVAYLNPTDDREAGYGGLLGQTLQTTRRPDVLKVAATFLAYGRRGLGAMLDTCNDLARYAEQRIATEPQLELIAPVTLTTVVFRYRCADLDAVNAELRRRLIRSGVALIGRTRVSVAGADTPQTCLKLTLLNPDAHESDIDALFDGIMRVALEVESESPHSTAEMARERS